MLIFARRLNLSVSSEASSAIPIIVESTDAARKSTDRCTGENREVMYSEDSGMPLVRCKRTVFAGAFVSWESGSGTSKLRQPVHHRSELKGHFNSLPKCYYVDC